MAVLDTVKQSPLLEGLDSEELQSVMPLCAEVKVARGKHLFEEGRPADHLYVIDRGKIALRKVIVGPDGSEVRPPYGGPPKRMTIGEFRPYAAIGWSALVEPYVMTLSARAEAASDLVSVDAVGLRALLDDQPSLGHKVHDQSREALGEATDRHLRS